MQNRHRTLDTSKIFSMKPPDPNQPCIWGRITIGTRTTVTPNTDPVAGEGVTILVGANLSLAGPGRIPSDIDVVRGDVIYAEVKTQADGTFRIPLPPGQYSLLIWKEGCIPQTRVNVQVWPGQVFYTLLQDNQPGRPRLHQFLDTTANNIPRRAIDPRPGIRGVIRVTDQGIRKPAADVTILVGTDLVLDQPQIPNPVTGPLRSEPGTQARLVVLTDPEADGRRIAFLARAHESKWTDYLPTFDAILTSIKFTSAGTNLNTPTTATKPTTPPPVVANTLKELVKVARIPDFAAAVAYTAYEDRVLFTNADNKTAAIGVAGRGKAIGAAFRDYLSAEPAVAALLGEAVSLEMTVLGNTLVAQVFEGARWFRKKPAAKCGGIFTTSGHGTSAWPRN
jgi:hypothetical protein